MNMKRKILFIKTNNILNSLDGVDRILIEFAKYNHLNKDYDFIFLFNVKCKSSEFISSFAKVKIINFPEPYIKSFIKRVIGLIKTWIFIYFLEPEVVIELAPYHKLLSFVTNKRSFIINYFHALMPQENKFEDLFVIRTFLRNKIFFNFSGRDLIIVNNMITKEKFIKDGFNPSEIYILKNGFPIISNKMKISYLNAEIQSKKIRVVGLGRLNLRKGGRDFCEFAKYINNDKFQFSYMGVIKNIKDITYYESMKDYVNILGHIDNIYDYLFYSDIAIHFSHEETGSLVLREMMSVGLPIIAWDIPTVNQDLGHQSELLVPKGNFQEAKNKLFLLRDNIDKRKEIGLKNISLSEKYTTKDMYNNFINILVKEVF